MAGYSEVQIANWAISYCGISQTITSLTEASPEAKACNLHYGITRDIVLESFPWGFATKYTTLQLVQEFVDGDEEANDWLFSYRRPTDCIAIRRIVTANGLAETTPVPYAEMQDDQGILVLTSVEAPAIEYTARFEDPQFFSPTFAKALSWALAAEIAFPLSVSENVRQRALEMAQKIITAAKMAALNERRVGPSPDSSFIQARE